MNATLELLDTYRESRNLGVRDRLVTQHLGLVRHLCRRFRLSREPQEDVFQVGVIGLLKAIEKFDTRRGSSFFAFAIPEITGEIHNYFRDHGQEIRPPRGVRDNLLTVQRIQDVLAQKLGRWPTKGEVAQGTGLSQDAVYKAFELESRGRPLSLNTSARSPMEEEEPDLTRLLGQEDKELESLINRLAPEVAMKALDLREKRIILLSFFRGLPQRQVARRMGLSQMHISRLQRRAVAKLRRAFDH